VACLPSLHLQEEALLLLILLGGGGGGGGGSWVAAVATAVVAVRTRHARSQTGRSSLRHEQNGHIHLGMHTCFGQWLVVAVFRTINAE
jgi:hypothetical protein